MSERQCCRQDDTADFTPAAWFARMIPNCLDYVTGVKEQGRPIVGMMCEYTPRELIMAAGGVPVCLCGGSAKTIEPAERDLPNNLCPLVKSTYGYHVLKSNPFLEMSDLIVAETTCDGKKKMLELMGQTRPLHVLALPQQADDEGARNTWYRELGKLKEMLERRFTVKITDDALREASRVMNRERALRRAIAGLMKADCPPLTGRQVLQMKSSISGLLADFAQYERVVEQAGAGCANQASKVRVLLTGVPLPTGAERVLELIEEHGGLVVCQENCTGLRPLLDDVDIDHPDPLRAIADKYYHLPCSVMTPNARRLDLLRRLTAEYRAECIIELVWQACITYDVEAYFVRKLAEEELRIPYLRIQTDYSPADSARITVRIQALFEMVQGRKVEP